MLLVEMKNFEEMEKCIGMSKSVVFESIEDISREKPYLQNVETCQVCADHWHTFGKHRTIEERVPVRDEHNRRVHASKPTAGTGESFWRSRGIQVLVCIQDG